AFNWLRGNGVIDVYAPAARGNSVRITFTASSIGEPRMLVAQSGGSTEHVTVTLVPRRITLGPFPLALGRAHILLRTSPGPRRYRSDTRLLSVRFAQLSARTSSSEG